MRKKDEEDFTDPDSSFNRATRMQAHMHSAVYAILLRIVLCYSISCGMTIYNKELID